LAADQRRLPDDVEAETGASAGVGDEQAAQHAYGRGLAAAVGAEKPADLAGRDLQVKPVDHASGAEALAQLMDIDDEVRHRTACCACASRTVVRTGRTAMGWPGLIVAACSGDGRASAM
jgi:hypothetical protein